jgi:hypothetical protein
LGESAGKLGVVEGVELGAGDRPAHLEAEVFAHLFRDEVVVARDHLHLDAEAVQPAERICRVGLRTVHERQEARQREVTFVVSRELRPSVRGPRGDGDDAAALPEQPVQHGMGLQCDDRAPSEHLFRGALDDDAPLGALLHKH